MTDDMIANSADIKFACSQCGQRIVVEKSAAGLRASCPICSGPVIVPHSSSIHERRARVGGEERTVGSGAFTDPGTEETREELFSSVVDHGQTERQLDEARMEIERLRVLFKKAVDECERITANATHAQAEAKSFQSDRQQLKADLSQTRQRAHAAESQVAELAAGIAIAQHENAALRERIDNDLALSRERLEATETQLAVRERELAAAQAENFEVVQSLADAQSELVAARADRAVLRSELETVQQSLREGAEIRERLTSAQQDLQSRFDEAIAEGRRLSEERDRLRDQAETLRHDLVETDSGRELLELRNQLRDLTDEQARVAAALAEKTAEAQSLTTSEQVLRRELQGTRQRCEDAEQRAAASSETQMQKDNDILRGILARQNATLSAYHQEVRGLRRGRYSVRFTYGLFALGLLALVFFAMSVFSSLGFGAFLGQLFR
jgi:chromosome segregation ATPase/DNA-directed RNA polymerase subunit RPC12/RpoP